jgi:hypothetical protein
MTFVVHKDFRERVQPTPVDKKLPDLHEPGTEENME